MTPRLSDRPLVLDAAIGTRLIALGLDVRSDDPALWNLKRPDAVLDLHRRDIEAGADAIVTNTFGANRCWLGRFHAGHLVREVNSRAVELARQAAGVGKPVFGSIGPTAGEDLEAGAEQAAALCEAGVDALVLETYRFPQAEVALRTLHGQTSVAVVVSLVEWPEPLEHSAQRLIDDGAAVLGMNCQVGMEPALRWAERLGPCIGVPLWVKPSGGLPGQPVEPPESFAGAVPRLLDAGVRFVGGCCGTTEVHIAALRAAVDRTQSAAAPRG